MNSDLPFIRRGFDRLKLYYYPLIGQHVSYGFCPLNYYYRLWIVQTFGQLARNHSGVIKPIKIIVVNA